MSSAMEPPEARRRLGAAIAAARAAAGTTQEQLGRATGLGQTVVSRIESGRRRVDSHELTRIAAALGVEIGVLIGAGDAAADYRDRLRELGDAELELALEWVPGFLDDLARLERLEAR
jgi:transcriptional regulator with XRE-family HTH domain